MSKTALVTGGGSFIGSHVVEHLVSEDFNVVVLDDLSSDFQGQVNPRAKFIQGSITDAQMMQSLFDEHSFRYVYHTSVVSRSKSPRGLQNEMTIWNLAPNLHNVAVVKDSAFLPVVKYGSETRSCKVWYFIIYECPIGSLSKSILFQV